MKEWQIQSVLSDVREKALETEGRLTPFLFMVPKQGPAAGFNCSNQACLLNHGNCLKEFVEMVQEFPVDLLAFLMILAHEDWVFVVEGSRKKLKIWELKIFRSPGFALVEDYWKESETRLFDGLEKKLI